VLYHHVLNHMQLKRNLQVGVVVHTQRKRYSISIYEDECREPGVNFFSFHLI
jgi:hypothetical protein